MMETCLEYVDLTNAHLNLGDRVAWVPEWSRWCASDSNPTDCTGTVVGTPCMPGWLVVEWDNGEYNTYKLKDQDLLKV